MSMKLLQQSGFCGILFCNHKFSVKCVVKYFTYMAVHTYQFTENIPQTYRFHLIFNHHYLSLFLFVFNLLGIDHARIFFVKDDVPLFHALSWSSIHVSGQNANPDSWIYIFSVC